MKVLGINGSPRKQGNTAAMIRTVFEELENEGIATELYQLGGTVLRGCTGCRTCFERQDEKCVFGDDGINDAIARMKEADGFIIGSPTYFADLTAETKALIDRAGYVGLSNGGMFYRKVGAAVVAVRRAGAVHVFDSINHFFFIICLTFNSNDRSRLEH
ncbi:MAG: flavodoxin family protein [Candidatus Aminicenantaceae bacterium]